MQSEIQVSQKKHNKGASCSINIKFNNFKSTIINTLTLPLRSKKAGKPPIYANERG
jgi:hypothetical protein